MPYDGVHKMSETAEPEHLYAKREAVHPQLVHGKYRLTKWIVLFVTLGIYYLLPWLRWPRAPHEPSQAVLVDFEGARLYFFSIEIWPDEFYLVTGLLVLSALALFFVTSVWGRLWCGYTCPQTVWTDLFIAVERAVEGDRNKRLQLAKQPWTAAKITKKVTKHSIWLLIAMATGGAWVLYFHDAPTVVGNFLSGTAPASSYLFVGILTFTTYSLAGLMREQVCTYMCPWPRIQGAMTDDKTFQVGYYALRGEPRGKHKKGADWSELGDCIDCNGCVVACPMGIDIRDGDQLECINCGLCIDACDSVMKKVGLPKGLIAYGADYRAVKDPKARKRLPQFFRARTVFYATVTALVAAIMLVALTTKGTMEFGVERDRAPAFTRLSDGSIRNAITVRALNKHSEPHEYALSLTGSDDLIVNAVGHEVEDGTIHLEVRPDKQIRLRAFLTLPRDETRNQRITITLTDQDTGEAASETIDFLSPSD